MYLQDIRRNIISPNDDTPFRFESQVFSSIHYYLIDISRCVRSSSAVFSVASSKILPTDRLKKPFYTHLVKYLLYENQQSYEKAHPLDSSNQKCVPIFYIILCIDKCIKLNSIIRYTVGAGWPYFWNSFMFTAYCLNIHGFIYLSMPLKQFLCKSYKVAIFFLC